MTGAVRNIQAATVIWSVIESIEAESGTLTYPLPCTDSEPPSGPSATHTVAASRPTSVPVFPRPDQSRAVALPGASLRCQSPIRSFDSPVVLAAALPPPHDGSTATIVRPEQPAPTSANAKPADRTSAPRKLRS